MTSQPQPLDRDQLPAVIRDLLDDDEIVLYWAQPIRRAGGIGVWMIMGLGVAFTVASAGAVEEIVRRGLELEVDVARGALLVVVAVGALLFLGFSVMMLFWPWLSDQARRSTHAVVTDRRVLEVRERTGARARRGPRVKEWPVTSCEAASVARRRGESATLVLREQVRERRTDGKTIYEWDALHGLPRADEALAALVWARAEALRAVHEAATPQ